MVLISSKDHQKPFKEMDKPDKNKLQLQEMMTMFTKLECISRQCYCGSIYKRELVCLIVCTPAILWTLPVPYTFNCTQRYKL